MQSIIYKIFLVFSVCIFSLPIYGQTVIQSDSSSHWKLKLLANFNLSQAAFSSNWKAGGVNAIGMNFQIAGQADYTNGRHSWNTELELLYGFLYTATDGLQKTVDRIYLDTKYMYSLSERWGLFASYNLLSQFAAGYLYEQNTRVIQSGIFAPAYNTFALGAYYRIPDYFEARFSPYAPRLTLVDNPSRFVAAVGEKPYGVAVGENIRFEHVGLQLVLSFNKQIAENINLNARYTLYANYEEFDLEGHRADHRLDVKITAKVIKYIDVILGGSLLYDYDQDKDVQLSELLNIGFAYAIQNYKEEKK